MRKQKAIIVGAGIAGIATAIRLVVKGYEVEVHEKNTVAGGKMYLIEKQGYKLMLALHFLPSQLTSRSYFNWLVKTSITISNTAHFH